LTIDNISEYKSLLTYQDAFSAKKKVVDDIKEIIHKHPMIDGKLKLFAIKGRG
jgi:hypothetical protein